MMLVKLRFSSVAVAQEAIAPALLAVLSIKLTITRASLTDICWPLRSKHILAACQITNQRLGNHRLVGAMHNLTARFDDPAKLQVHAFDNRCIGKDFTQALGHDLAGVITQMILF